MHQCLKTALNWRAFLALVCRANSLIVLALHADDSDTGGRRNVRAETQKDFLFYVLIFSISRLTLFPVRSRWSNAKNFNDVIFSDSFQILFSIFYNQNP